MCGVTGCVAPIGKVSEETLAFWTRNATAALEHRGPDDSGIWIDGQLGVGLGHRRLSIIDVSTFGHQPMISKDGRFVITYNGEVYNFPELRRDLQSANISFDGRSDTEVLLAGIVHWGLIDTLLRVNGMFALALWDRSQQRLHLARDRFGQKPLYYGWAGNVFAFGSTLEALRQFPDFCGEIDSSSISLLLRHSNIPAPYTIYKNCWKLMPGTTLTLELDSVKTKSIPQPVKYWSAEDTAISSSSNPISASTNEVVDTLDSILRTAVGNCMLSDVPLGAFLSGGIDSSIVVSLMQAQSHNPVQTFSIGFSDSEYDEAQYAKNIAKYLGTNHTELYVTAKDAQNVIPELPKIYDEPFADSSQIPTYLVSQLAREQVTVCLSGDGGDELFGGYNRYAWSRNLQLAIKTLPSPFRSWAARNLLSVRPQTWDKVYSKLLKYGPGGRNLTQFGDKLHKLAEIIDAPTKEEMYWRLVSQWKNPGKVLIDHQEYITRANEWNNWPPVPSFTQQIMLLDTLFYLPDDILVKLDRASMAVGLETRVPLLDHNLFEFSWALPERFKIKKGVGKWIVKKLLHRYIPRRLFERPKMGFGVPIGDWLRSDLREWAEDLLSSERLVRDQYFKPLAVQKIWQEHLSGHQNHQHMLWPLLMFQAWLTQYR